jgi:hypothetical protein
MAVGNRHIDVGKALKEAQDAIASAESTEWISAASAVAQLKPFLKNSAFYACNVSIPRKSHFGRRRVRPRSPSPGSPSVQTTVLAEHEPRVASQPTNTPSRTRRSAPYRRANCRNPSKQAGPVLKQCSRRETSNWSSTSRRCSGLTFVAADLMCDINRSFIWNACSRALKTLADQPRSTALFASPGTGFGLHQTSTWRGCRSAPAPLRPHEECRWGLRSGPFSPWSSLLIKVDFYERLLAKARMDQGEATIRQRACRRSKLCEAVWAPRLGLAQCVGRMSTGLA